jgi:hypothetical protein
MSEEILEDLVPERVFWRGEDLYREDAVQSIEITAGQISARVSGKRLYTVKAEFSEDEYLFSCSCPYEGFCKHSIALGLWMVEHKNEWSPWKARQEHLQPGADITTLIEKATPVQKDTFLFTALNEFPVLLNRFEVMIKGAVNLGGEIDIDCLIKEIKTEMESFDLENYERFYDRASERHGYREEWEILSDGVEAEFTEIFDKHKNRVLELLKIGNIIGSFKCLLAVYEAVQTADFELIKDPACVYEEGGLYDLADLHLQQLLRTFISGFSTLAFEERVYRKLIDIFFKRFAVGKKTNLYQIGDFTEILIWCIQTKNIAVYLANHLRNDTDLPEADYCEILLAVHEKSDAKDSWLGIAENYYKVNRKAAESLLQHFAADKKKLMQFARDIAFDFNNEFIPFFYENLNKNDDPPHYKSIFHEHARKTQSVELYHAYKKEYGSAAAQEFIAGLESDWSAEKFYILLLKEEKAYEQLLSLAKKKSAIQPAMAYLRPVVHVFPADVFKIISAHAGRLLEENSGRNYYRQAAEWLKLLKEISSEKTKGDAADFIRHLIDRYRNRPALKDEFSKAGLT